MATQILVAQGNAPVTGDIFSKLTVLGGGPPVWEKLETLGVPRDDRARVAVLISMDATGVKGSRYVASGKVNCELEVKRVWNLTHHVYK